MSKHNRSGEQPEPDRGRSTAGYPTPEGMRWATYKQRRAHAMIDRGYSVAWAFDESDWFEVYVAAMPHTWLPELRAELRLNPTAAMAEPPMRPVLQHLSIYTRALRKLELSSGNPLRQVREELVTLLFNTRSPSINDLRGNLDALALYQNVLEEFG